MSSRDFRDQFEPGDVSAFVRPALTILVVLVLLYVAFQSYYTVAANEQAVVLRFGRYQATTLPGLHFCIPLVDQVLKVSVEEHSIRLPPEGIRGRYVRGQPTETLMLTGDLNAASVEWTVQWKIQDPKEYLFSFYQRGNDGYVEDVIRIAAQTVMNRLVGDHSIYEVLTDKRTAIAEEARTATQDILNEYACGVTITELQMQRVTPPTQVKPAFAAVNSAVQKRDQLENEANKERNKLIPAARAERDQKIKRAEGYAARRRAEVNGEIKALMAKYEAYNQAPEVTRERLYLEAMQTILSGIRNKTIIDSELQQILPLLQLDPGGDER